MRITKPEIFSTENKKTVEKKKMT